MKCFSAILCTLSVAAASGAVGGAVRYVPNQLAVQMNPGVPAYLRYPLPGAIVREIPELDVCVIRLPDGSDVDAALIQLSKRTDLVFAERIAYKELHWVPNDTSYASQYGLQKIQAEAAWDLTLGSPSVVVGVIDDGIELNHPDLVQKLVQGRDISDNDSDPSHDVNGGHGSHTAGIIGAETNNGLGVASIGNRVRVMPIKIFPNATDAASAQAMVYAVDHGCRVLSMSYGSSSPSMTEQAGVNYAWSRGAVLVASAGNNGNSNKMYPAAYSNVVAVASTNSNDARSGFSTFGYWVQVAAPGENILSTYPGGYALLSGTSMACPMVSGTVGLMWSVASPGTSNAQIVSRLENACDNVGPFVQFGRINAYTAVRAAGLVRTAAQPTAISQVFGTYTGGNLASLQAVDSDYYNSLTTLTASGQVSIVDLTFPAPGGSTNIALFQLDAALVGNTASSAQYWIRQNSGTFQYLGATAVDATNNVRTLYAPITNLAPYIQSGQLVIRSRVTRPMTGVTKPTPFTWGINYVRLTTGVVP